MSASSMNARRPGLTKPRPAGHARGKGGGRRPGADGRRPGLSSPRRAGLAIVVFLLVSGLAGSAGGQGAGTPGVVHDLPGDFPVPLDLKHPRLDSRLVRVQRAMQEQGPAAARELAVRQGLPLDETGRVRVLVHESVPATFPVARSAQAAAEEAVFAALEPRVRGAIEAAGGRVRGRVANLIEAEVPVRGIGTLAEEPAVAWIQPPPEGRILQGQVISEGVATTRANLLQGSEASYRPAGEPVKVGVLDGGFQGHAALLGRELPASVTTRSFHPSGLAAGTTHGTAVAEIVHDMAPDAELVLVNFDGSSLVSHGRAVSYLISQGVDVISYSIGYANQVGPGDGRGPINDDVRRALDAGIQWVGAAGNEAENHWDGRFSDPDGDRWHNFQGADETNAIRLDPGVFFIYLDWDDWFTSNQDYDMYLFDSTASTILLRSENAQTGSQPPLEVIAGIAFVPLTVHLAIRRFSASRNVQLQLFNPKGRRPQHFVRFGSINIPADTEGAIAVGATHWSTDGLEAFSSRGPTADGRVKPDIVAPNRVRTIGLPGFAGTSAATPHVSGALALVRSRFGIFDLSQVREILMGRALERGAPGKDNLFGEGRLDLIGGS